MLRQLDELEEKKEAAMAMMIDQRVEDRFVTREDA